MNPLVTITTEYILNDTSVNSDGHYNIMKHGESFSYDGVKYTYYSSGLCRTVYLSACGKFVIKVPNGSFHDTQEELDEYLKNNLKYADPSITHNVGEGRAYSDCPKEYKTYLAKTELLPNCWVRQEFVEVLPCSFTGKHDLREIGRRSDGTFCIFDYDPLLDDFEWTGSCNWERLKSLVLDIQKTIENK